jgi:HNH endonuclease
MEREYIRKSIRFEVFKRDSFTCQYCGAKSPDVLLQVDQIEPVSKGGTNDILNLVTSCEACNAGKSDRRLSDTAVIDKQRQQLEALQERKEQIEMMFQWQKSLMQLDDHLLQQLASFWSELIPTYSLNEAGKRGLQKLLKRFAPNEIMEAMRIAAQQYLDYEGDRPTHASVENAWSKVGGICALKEKQKDKPYLKDLFYIRGILRNRLRYVNERQALQWLEEAVQLGASVEELKQQATEARNWTEWRAEIQEYISQQLKKDTDEPSE